jgi:hypothetical protein
VSVICTEDASELKADPADAGSLLGVDLITAMRRSARSGRTASARRISARRSPARCRC